MSFAQVLAYGKLGRSVTKLSTIKPRLGGLSSRIGASPRDERERSRQRDSAAWRQWYKTARWQKLRWAILTRDLFTCRMCRRVVADTSQLVADHKVPHRGDERLFWDPNNIQCLCKPCHDREKQRTEQGEIKGVWY